MNKTYVPKKNHQTTWYLIDAKDKTLGRLSTEISKILRGKNNITYTPYLNNISYVIVTNAQEIKVTGVKKQHKVYKRHSGRPGGMKIETFEQLQKRIPNRIIEKSIKGMLPKGPLGRKLFNKLKVYSDSQHPHAAQNPQIISLN